MQAGQVRGPKTKARAEESHPSTEVGSGESLSEFSSASSDESDDDDPPPFSPQETIMIFDWDDTMLPSTWLNEQGLTLEVSPVLTSEQEAILGKIAEQAQRTLAVAKARGKVVCVTNAEQGWIEMSCKKFMPSLFPSLEDISILSARSEYERQGVTSPFEWKHRAFHYEIGRFCETFAADGRKNVISLGDSAHEREALIRVTEQLQNCYIKSVKFVERPQAQQLLKEHQLMKGCFPAIINHMGNLDLCLRCE